MKKIKTKNKAFTLIELLVVIVIIGILAGIGVSQFNDYKLKSEIADATVEMKLIEKAILLARINTQKTMNEITENPCSYCSCGGGLDLRILEESNPCMQTWLTNINKIADASGIEEIPFYRDAWGSPYIFDENEAEWDHDYCRKDSLYSAGPDGIFSGAPGGVGQDNIKIEIPFYDTKRCPQ